MKLLSSTNALFFEAWPIIETGNFRTISQLEFKYRPPYLSRLDFEKIIERLPNGYDTTLEELSVLREVNLGFVNFFNKLQEKLHENNTSN